MKTSRLGIIVSVLPSVLSLALFYSLAIHMHHALGSWPSSIGEIGFPPTLLTHATVATTYFWVLLMLSIFIVPLAVLVCLVVSPWRHLIRYFVLYALVFAACIGAMMLAPEPFIYWWRD